MKASENAYNKVKVANFPMPEIELQSILQHRAITMNLDNDSNDLIIKPANINYENDLKSAVQYTRWLLTILGIWPIISKNSSKTSQYFSPIVIIMCNSIMAFIVIPTTLHMILREKSAMVKLMLIAPIGSCCASFLKYGLIVFCSKTIRLCLEHMETDWMTIECVNERAIMTKNARLGRGLTVTAATIMYSGGVFYHLIMPIMKGSKINEFNETIRPIIYPGFDIFVEAQKSPNYEIIYFGTILSGVVRYTITLACCSIAAVFVSHACGQVQIVMARLKNLFDGIEETLDVDKLQERISSIIHSHVRGLGLSSKIDEALRKIYLVEVVAATIVICLLEYSCMMEWNNSNAVGIITFVILLFSYCFNIFIVCHIGELLKEQYHEVATASYMIEWYNLPGKSGLALVMVIAMANIPRKLTAGHMIDLSVTSFGAIIKTSVVYLNMFRTLED